MDAVGLLLITVKSAVFAPMPSASANAAVAANALFPQGAGSEAHILEKDFHPAAVANISIRVLNLVEAAKFLVRRANGLSFPIPRRRFSCVPIAR